MRNALIVLFFWGYQLTATGTFLYLCWEDLSRLNWWNWIVLLPINVLLGEAWPIYWLVRWLF